MHLLALGLFLLLTAMYFTPVLSGKVAKQHDVMMWKGAYQEVKEFKAKSGHAPLWSNTMFGGMPTYTYGGLESKANITPYLDAVMKLWLPSPMETIFLLMVCFYILMLTFGVSPWLSIIGAVAYAFSSYNFINLDAGHLTKGWAIAYLPLIFAGLNLTFRCNKWLGAALTGIACALELNAGHLQITYYAFLLALVWVIAYGVQYVKEKRIKEFIICGLFAAVGAGIGLGTGTTGILIGSEYQKESQRSPSVLKGQNKEEDANKTTGLDKDYALEYSYTITEPLTILVPDMFGGASSGELGKKSHTWQTLKDNNIPEDQIKGFTKTAPLYWGELRFTAGPTYFGAIVCFLFVLGLFVVKGPEKWWLVGGSVFAILLSYGKYFPLLTDFFFDYVPYYNKFRAVTFILVLAQMCFPVLGVLALREFTREKANMEQLKKGLLYAAAVTGGLLVLLIIGGGIIYDFSGPVDKQLPDWLLESLRDDRQSIMRTDALRSLFFVAAAFAAIWYFVKQKLKLEQFALLLAFLVVVDLWMVDRRYLNNKDFEAKKSKEKDIPMTEADRLILQDTTLNYRVFNTTVSPFNDATTSYYHKSIGGYSAAKVRRYQDLIERQIGNQNMHVLDMLNTKYFIVNDSVRGPMPSINPNACGNAWFIPQYKLVPGPDEEMAALTNFDPKTVAFIDKMYEKYLNGFQPQPDPSAQINLIDYNPDFLTYKSQTGSEQLAIFSEVYFDKGWNAYLDGKPVEHIRANYVLRAMRVPAGAHTIEFKFEPATFAKGEKISMAFTTTLYLGSLLIVGFSFFRRKKEQA